MIKIAVIGYIGMEPQRKFNEKGEYFTFTIASSNKKESPATWFTVYTKQMNVLPYLKKGKQIFVEGRLESRAYLKTDGKPEISLSILFPDIVLMSSESKSEPAPQSQNAANSYPAPNDLPF